MCATEMQGTRLVTVFRRIEFPPVKSETEPEHI